MTAIIIRLVWQKSHSDYKLLLIVFCVQFCNRLQYSLFYSLSYSFHFLMKSRLSHVCNFFVLLLCVLGFIIYLYSVFFKKNLDKEIKMQSSEYSLIKNNMICPWSTISLWPIFISRIISVFEELIHDEWNDWKRRIIKDHLNIYKIFKIR